MPYYSFYFDPTYILVIVGLLISLAASAGVKSTFNKWSEVTAHSGATAAQVAEEILRGAGVNGVTIQHISGSLTDNFNPTTMTLNLSDDVYSSSSIAAIGVAAHEAGHAIQHKNGYIPIKIRSALVPVVNFGSRLAFPIILVGCFLSFNQVLITIGIILFALSLLFSIVTLPVEFNASGRAIRILGERDFLSDEELTGAKSVLRAAAMTYVASTLAIALQFLRLLLLFGGNRRRR